MIPARRDSSDPARSHPRGGNGASVRGDRGRHGSRGSHGHARGESPRHGGSHGDGDGHGDGHGERPPHAGSRGGSHGPVRGAKTSKSLPLGTGGGTHLLLPCMRRGTAALPPRPGISSADPSAAWDSESDTPGLGRNVRGTCWRSRPSPSYAGSLGMGIPRDIHHRDHSCGGIH